MGDKVCEVLRTMSDTKEQWPRLGGRCYCYPDKDTGFGELRKCLLASSFFTNSGNGDTYLKVEEEKCYLYCKFGQTNCIAF